MQYGVKGLWDLKHTNLITNNVAKAKHSILEYYILNQCNWDKNEDGNVIFSL